MHEGLSGASQAAAKEMKLWRSTRHWYSENPHESSAFLFGIGLHLDRPIIVLEQGQGGILDPCKIYASRQGDALCREPPTNGKAETIPSFFPIPFSDVITSLQRAPSAQSVLLYNGTNHFNALLYGEADDTADDAEVASITSQKAVPVAVRPIAAKAPLPTAIASLQAKTKRANEGGKEPKAKIAKPDVSMPDAEPDFELEGYAAMPPPTEVSSTSLVGKLVAHRFSVRDWAPGWAVGVVDRQSTAKRTRGQFEVNYGKEFSPPVYIHELNPSEYGTNWVVVTQEE
jgi:hypothetical protein